MDTPTTQTLLFETPGDHIVLLDAGGRRLLLDTGSPTSFGGGTLGLLGRAYGLDGALPGFDVGRLSELVGTRLDGLVGADVVAKVPFTIDWDSRTVGFHSDASAASGDVVPVTDLLGVPVAECDVAGRRVRAFVDTGATISFFKGDWSGLPEPIGSKHEFHPGPFGFEEFDTPLWKLPVQAGRRYDATFGRVPPALKAGLDLAGVDVILGADLWKHFRVLVDVGGGRLVLSGGPQ